MSTNSATLVLVSPRNPEPTRTAVLAAADELLEAGGPEAVTLRAVGAAAGVSRSAPYRHFEGKAELLEALALRTLVDLGTAIRRAAAAATGPEEQLRLGCRGYVDYALQHPQHYLLVFGSAPLGIVDPAIEAAADEGFAAVVDLVNEAQSAALLPRAPARELATVLWALLHGLAQLQLTRHLHEPRTVDGDTRLDELIDVALAAWRPIA